MKTDKHQTAGLVKYPGFGTSDRIRKELENGRRTIDELSTILDIPREKVLIAIQGMMGKTGGVITRDKNRSTKGKKYELYHPPQKQKVDPAAPFAKATRIEIGRGYRWGAGW